MEKQRIDPILTQEIEPLRKTDGKIYHTPLLNEWGSLQELTMGSGNLSSDDEFSGSTAGKRLPDGSVPPWLLP
jgi:hypothetical protein